MYYAPGRRGTVLILVLGLITLFMALMLSATVRVYNAGKTILTLQKNVQAYVMMQAAKTYIATGCGGWLGQCYYSTSPALKSFAGIPFADRLGWARVDGTKTNIISAGGSTAGSGGIKGSINDVCPSPPPPPPLPPYVSPTEAAMRNALEIRYHYQRDLVTGAITLMPVDDNTDNTKYPWL